ncbi:hypothetical protein VTI74DRAFT_10863 [Chaetomium olivicolor]
MRQERGSKRSFACALGTKGCHAGPRGKPAPDLDGTLRSLLSSPGSSRHSQSSFEGYGGCRIGRERGLPREYVCLSPYLSPVEHHVISGMVPQGREAALMARTRVYHIEVSACMELLHNSCRSNGIQEPLQHTVTAQ